MEYSSKYTLVFYRLDAHAEYNSEYISLCIKNLKDDKKRGNLGLRSFSVSPQNLLKVKRALLDTDAHPDAGEKD